MPEESQQSQSDEQTLNDQSAPDSQPGDDYVDLDYDGETNEDEGNEPAAEGEDDSAGGQGPTEGNGRRQAKSADAPAQVADLPDIPGVDAIAQADIDALAPLIDPTSDSFSPVEYTRRMIAITQNTARNEMQASSAAQYQMTRMLGGREQVVSRYGPGIQRFLQKVPAENRHKAEAVRSALLTAVWEESTTKGDAAFDEFVQVWSGGKKAVSAPARTPVQQPAQRTPSGSGGAPPPAASVSRNGGNGIQARLSKIYPGMSAEELDELAKTSGVAKGRVNPRG